MRKIRATSLFTVALIIGIYIAYAAQAKTTDFSGKWVLDKSRTPDLPPSLESYTMTVTQNAEQLAIETDSQGDLGMRGRPGGIGGPGGRRRSEGGAPGGSGQGGGFPGGRDSGGGPGGGGFSLPKDAVMGMALRTAPPKAIYSLDGKETLLQVEARESGAGRPSQPGGSIAFKANWKKGGKTLELQSNRKFETPEGERSMTSKDRWELSEDGNTLTVQRTIDMPMGVEEVKLVFTKQ
jgi:hypothetical protein